VVGCGQKRDGVKRGMGGGRRLLWWPGGAAERKGRGVPGPAPRGGREAGKREGAPGMVGDSSGSRHRPLDGGHGRWLCCATKEGGGARATLARVANRRDRETTGPGGQ
jgi:hypothetical protein